MSARNRPDDEVEVAELLAPDRRRYLLYCLYLYATPIRLPDIAYQATVWEADAASSDIDSQRYRTYMSLYHDHLPALIEADIVEYDQTDDTVTLGPAADAYEEPLEQYLAREIDTLLEAEGAAIAEDSPTAVSAEFHRALAAPVRRKLLARLLDQPEVSLDEVVPRLAARADGDTVTTKDRRQVRLALHHRHLPLLEDAGLVTYEPATGRISLASLSPAAQEALRTATRAARLTRTATLPDDERTDQGKGLSDPGEDAG